MKKIIIVLIFHTGLYSQNFLDTIKEKAKKTKETIAKTLKLTDSTTPMPSPKNQNYSITSSDIDDEWDNISTSSEGYDPLYPPLTDIEPTIENENDSNTSPDIDDDWEIVSNPSKENTNPLDSKNQKTISKTFDFPTKSEAKLPASEAKQIKDPELSHFDDTTDSSTNWTMVDSPEQPLKTRATTWLKNLRDKASSVINPSKLSEEEKNRLILNEKISKILEFAKKNPAFEKLVQLYEANSKKRLYLYKNQDPFKIDPKKEYNSTEHLRSDPYNINRLHKVMMNIKDESASQEAIINPKKTNSDKVSQEQTKTISREAQGEQIDNIRKERIESWKERERFIKAENNTLDMKLLHAV